MKNKPSDMQYCGVSRKHIKTANPTVNKKNLLRLYRFITRRYSIHLKKDVEGLPTPWTKDPILRRYRFTNVRREHDKTTRWLICNIASNSTLCYEDKLLNIILFRLYNNYKTAELLSLPIEFMWKYSDGKEWNPEWYRSLFEAQDRVGDMNTYFTSAFYLSGPKRTWKKLTNEKYVPMAPLKLLKTILQGDLIDRIQSCRSQVDVYNELSKVPGIGNFLAYQIFVDFTYVEDFPFSENEFTVAGLGCIKGLNYLFEDTDGMSPEECIFWLRDNIGDLFTDTLCVDWNPDKLFSDLPKYDRCMNVMSLENCMCELSKYIRAQDHTGRPRQVYRRN